KATEVPPPARMRVPAAGPRNAGPASGSACSTPSVPGGGSCSGESLRAPASRPGESSAAAGDSFCASGRLYTRVSLSARGRDRKSTRLWEPSQKGLLWDAPHRQRAMGFLSSTNSPPWASRSRNSPSTSSGPSSRVVMVAPAMDPPPRQGSTVAASVRARTGRHASGSSSLRNVVPVAVVRSEEHTSELQSRENLVCRLLHEKKKSMFTAENLLQLLIYKT